LGEFGAAADGFTVDRGEDGPPHITQRVERPIERPPLPQPLLRIHGFAFAQVGAAAKILSGSRHDGAPHGNFRLDLFDDLGEADAQRRRDRVAGLRPIEGDDGRSSAVDVFEEHGILGFVEVRRRFGVNSSPPLGGIWWDDRLRSFLLMITKITQLKGTCGRTSG
jgi:hypothetical protein